MLLCLLFSSRVGMGLVAVLYSRFLLGIQTDLLHAETDTSLFYVNIHYSSRIFLSCFKQRARSRAEARFPSRPSVQEEEQQSRSGLLEAGSHLSMKLSGTDARDLPIDP
jgi:hypothetical protein